MEWLVTFPLSWWLFYCFDLTSCHYPPVASFVLFCRGEESGQGFYDFPTVKASFFHIWTTAGGFLLFVSNFHEKKWRSLEIMMTVSVNSCCVCSSTDFNTYKIPHHSVCVCVCFNFANSQLFVRHLVSLLHVWPHPFVLENSVFRFQAICLTCDISILMSS